MSPNSESTPASECGALSADVPFDARKYWEKRLALHPGLVGVGYKRLGRSYNAWCYRLRSEVFRRLSREWHLTGRSLDVLDVGSGTGHYVREWLLAGARSVTATDLTSVATERLRGAFPNVPVRQLDITDELIPESLGQFDIVSAFDVLFHIVDDAAYERALRNCFALCRPGGYLVFSENFLHGPRATTGHMVSRSLDEIEHVLLRAGFVSLERKPMFVMMNHPTDVANRFVAFAWLAVVGLSVVSDRFGGMIGRLLFPFERWLVRSVIEGPSTEVMICRRPHGD